MVRLAYDDLAYASARSCPFLDRASYVPEKWAVDAKQCQAAGIPPSVQRVTKGGLAQAMLERAFVAHIPMQWVVGDTRSMSMIRRPVTMCWRFRAPTSCGRRDGRSRPGRSLIRCGQCLDAIVSGRREPRTTLVRVSLSCLSLRSTSRTGAMAARPAQWHRGLLVHP